jgi:hypothetical protein
MKKSTWAGGPPIRASSRPGVVGSMRRSPAMPQYLQLAAARPASDLRTLGGSAGVGDRYRQVRATQHPQTTAVYWRIWVLFPACALALSSPGPLTTRSMLLRSVAGLDGRLQVPLHQCQGPLVLGAGQVAKLPQHGEVAVPSGHHGGAVGAEEAFGDDEARSCSRAPGRPGTLEVCGAGPRAR